MRHAVTVASQPTRAFDVLRRVGFRFLFVYAFLYYLPFPFGLVPNHGPVEGPYERSCAAVVVWIAHHVLGVSREIRTGFPTGSGDTTYDWFRVAVLALLATTAATVWSALDRRRVIHPRLSAIVTIYVRYAVGASLVSYGMAKVIPMQFPTPTIHRFVEPLGDFSPMGLLWTWMGCSPAYNVFAGSAEVLGGLLLFFRRTTTLGALVGAAALANVVVLNFTYDVTVKLYSTHLLASALLLAAPDAGRLFRMLVLNRSTRPRPVPVLFEYGWKARIATIAKVAFVLWAVGSQIVELRAAPKEYAATERNTPIYGIWEVDSYSRNGIEAPPLVGDAKRLRRIVASGFKVSFFAMNDVRTDYRMNGDGISGTLSLSPFREPSKTISLVHRRIDNDHLALEGTLEGEAVVMALHRTDPSRMVLNARGFHWVQEYPFNR